MVKSFTLTKPEGWPIRYEIRNVLGAMVQSGETDVSTLTLSTQELPAGVYEFRALANGFVQTRQFVVVK